MNTRLQVEHPVTDDHRARPRRVAAARRRPASACPSCRDELRIGGHAFGPASAPRIPRNQFLPAIGPIDLLARRNQRRRAHRHRRARRRHHHTILRPDDRQTDRARRQPRAGAAATRAGARQLCRRRLQQQRRVPAARRAPPAFASGEIDTGFIARHADALLPPPPVPSDTALAACALVEAAAAVPSVAQDAARRAGKSSSPWRWPMRSGRTNPDCGIDFDFAQGEQRLTSA